MSSANTNDLGAKGPFNVVLVSFDTLRRDYVHAYGHPKPLSPTMDALAAQGVVFEDAVVNCSWTLPQHMTLVTGVYPIKHEIILLQHHRGRYRHLSSRFDTLAEPFQRNGYFTLGFGNLNAYATGWMFGYYRGMHHFTTIYPFNNAMEQMVEPIIGCIRVVRDKPFVLYIHTNDTHEPFAASEPFGSKWGAGYQNKYEGEVTYVDYYFGQIVEEIKRLGLYEKTLFVITSDHGTEFREHGFLEKKLNLYEEIAQIPLIVTLPGVFPAGKRISGLCQTADITPTILDVCSMPMHPEIDGRSLVPRILDSDAKATDIIFAHTIHEVSFRYEHFSARTDRYKFIRTVPFAARPQRMRGNIGERFSRLSKVAQLRDGIWRELYDLKADPGEQTNVIEKEPAIARELERRLDDWIRSCGYTPRKSGMKA